MNIAIFLPGRTANLFIYSETAEASITPGRSLLEKTKGRSKAPCARTTDFALIRHNFCLGELTFVSGE